MLSFEALSEYVVFEADDLDHLPLQQFKALTQIVVLFRHLFIDFFLILRYHEVKILVSWDLAEFKISVGLDRHVKVALLAANFLLVWVSLRENSLFDWLLKLSDLKFLAAQLVAILNFLVLYLCILRNQVDTLGFQLRVFFFCSLLLVTELVLKVLMFALKLLVTKSLRLELFLKLPICAFLFVQLATDLLPEVNGLDVLLHHVVDWI